MSADYPGAEEHFVPRSFMFNSNAHVACVIHKTGGDATPQHVYNTFMASGKSVHYAVGTDGTIWQFVPEDLGAGGNCCTEAGYDPFWAQYVNAYGNLNLCTISIEHCDAALDNSTPVPPAQKEASFKLVAYLAKKYSIPVSHIKTHASIDPQSRARCPGNYPMSELLTYVQQGGSMPVPTGWSDNGTTLTASNKVPVVAGFRQHILNAASWDSGNQPQETEYHTDQVLLHNPGVGVGQRQMFRDTMLWYTTAKGVVEEKQMGLELDTAYKQIAALKAQLAQQQQPASVDTTQAVADVQAIADAVGQAAGTAIAKAVLTIKGL